jgi:predicted porin
MRKTLIVTAIAATCPTFGQSQLSTDGLNSSRLGFRGIEDLGGGLKAGFWLESQVNADTGTPNASRFWHRRATVNLQSSSLGELRLGRDQLPTWTAVGDFDVFGTNGIGDTATTYAVLGGIDTRARADNLVAYFLPSSLGGLYGHLALAAGEGTPGRKHTGGRIGWRSGPFDVTAAYAETEVSTDHVELVVLAGSYDFGAFKLSGIFQEASYQDDQDTRYTLGASLPFGQALLRASYTHTDGSGSIGNRDADSFAIGGVYNLGRRTALYATCATIDNSGTANFTVGSMAGRTMPKTEERSQGFEVGVRHSF